MSTSERKSPRYIAEMHRRDESPRYIAILHPLSLPHPPQPARYPPPRRTHYAPPHRAPRSPLVPASASVGDRLHLLIESLPDRRRDIRRDIRRDSSTSSSSLCRTARG